ncbi:MAG: ribosome silencing factor [Candidatus Omnitrophica bacterium]|nr:ribosome silencing factor [Candidatus Omnitrophota bacterium]
MLVADFASSKKAEKIVILDMRKVANFCDFFIVCSGSSDRRVKAIADGIIDGLEAKSVHIHHAEGREQAKWIVIDLGDILIHIFEEKVRDFYNLEHLWQDAKKIAYQNKSAD